MRCSLGLSVALLLSHSAFALKDGTPGDATSSTTPPHGDCHTGCWHPLETEHNKTLTFDDCLKWFQSGCPNDVWPGHAQQNHPNCWPGANAVSYAEDDGTGSGGAICRIWSCVKEPIYDGNPAFTCHYKPQGFDLGNTSNPVNHAYYAPLQDCSLNDTDASGRPVTIESLNGVMTPDQAKLACTLYQNSSEDAKKNNDTMCAGFWYDQQKTEEPTAPNAPCTIQLGPVVRVDNDTITRLLEGLDDCYLQKDGDSNKEDRLGGCSEFQITFKTETGFTFQNCENKTITIAPPNFAAGQRGATMSAAYGAASGILGCESHCTKEQSTSCTGECGIYVYENKFNFHFYSKFNPTCGNDDSALLRSGDASSVPIAIQTAYGYSPKEVTLDHGNEKGFIWCDQVAVSYGDAWKNCMGNPACQTFEYSCTDLNGNSHDCDNSRPSKFPSTNRHFCYSTWDYTHDKKQDTSFDTYAVYRKIRQVPRPSSSEDSEATVNMTYV
jgi:hypothetical protein